MTLFDNEVAAIVALRRKGRTFSYIAEEIGVCREVIGRELRAQGIATGHVNADRRARRGQMGWTAPTASVCHSTGRENL
jgi:IS30 family transposase